MMTNHPHYKIIDNTEFSCDLFPYAVAYISRPGLSKVMCVFSTWDTASIFKTAIENSIESMTWLEAQADYKGRKAK